MSNLLRLLKNPVKNICTKSSVRLGSSRSLVKGLKDVLLVGSKANRVQDASKNVFTGLQRLNFCTRVYDINTNVTKDVILYKYENPRFFKILNIFGICQFIFWTYLSHFAFTTLRDAPVEHKEGEELKWYERINLGENKYRNGITIMSFIIGMFFHLKIPFLICYFGRLRHSGSRLDVYIAFCAVFDTKERWTRCYFSYIWSIWT